MKKRIDEFRDEIRESLMPLSHKARVLFSIAICERLYPAYVAFQETCQWGDHQIVRDGITVLRQYTKEGKTTVPQIKEAMAKMELVNPQYENFSKVILFFACDAWNAVHASLNYLLDKTCISYTIHVGSIARDTTYMYIVEMESLKTNDPEFEHKINSNKLMIRELTTQRQLLKKLAVMNLEKMTDQRIDALIDNETRMDLKLLT